MSCYIQCTCSPVSLTIEGLSCHLLSRVCHPGQASWLSSMAVQSCRGMFCLAWIAPGPSGASDECRWAVKCPTAYSIYSCRPWQLCISHCQRCWYLSKLCNVLCRQQLPKALEQPQDGDKMQQALTQQQAAPSSGNSMFTDGSFMMRAPKGPGGGLGEPCWQC